MYWDPPEKASRALIALLWLLLFLAALGGVGVVVALWQLVRWVLR